MSELGMLKDAVGKLLAEAQAAFTVEANKEAIKASTTKLVTLLKEWQSYDRNVQRVIFALLETVRSACTHEGADRGYNERDGSWMNTCPTCGATK